MNLYIYVLKGHWEPPVDVGSLNLAECILVFELKAFRL